jgi:hypothetical protein
MALEDHDASYWMSGDGPSSADVDAARAKLTGRASFRTVVDEVLRESAAAGMAVERVSVENLLAVQMMGVATQMGIRPSSALRYAKAEPLVRTLAELAAAAGATAVRPARIPGQRSITPIIVCGRMIEALGQVAKFATANQDKRIADHAADLVTELGAALREMPEGDDAVTAATGVFAEAGTLLDDVAARMDSRFWSTCPCGQQHGQSEQDAAVVPHLRADAELARMIAAAAA